jgi:protein-disulfide isomerase
MTASNSGDKGTRNLVIVMVAFIVVVGVVFSIISNRASSNYEIPAAVSAEDGYGIVLNPTATPKIDVYLDYQCPACRAFELQNGAYLNEVTIQKKAKVVYHPMTFIGPESILAANAAACSADENKFIEMNLALFQNQPTGENTGRWTNDTLIAIANAVGITSENFSQCVNDGKYVKWTKNITIESGKANVNSTPTVLINGKPLDRDTEYGDPVKFRAALAAAGVQ